MRYKVLFIILFSSFSFVFGQNVEKRDTVFQSTEDPTQDLDSLLYLWYAKYDTLPNDDFADIDTSIVNQVSDTIIKERLDNLVSIIDMPYNDKVAAFINLYTIKRKKQMSIMLGLSDYYFPIIEASLDKYDLPLELKYMAVIESALNPRARSRAGATGLWQFMYATGKIYGLEVNSYVDYRRDPVQASEAAAKFLKDLYAIYHDWTLVIAAYNCGPGNVNKAIRRSGGKRDFWDIYYRLPRETRGYVPAFIAANYAFAYYKEYNIKPNRIDLNVATDTIIINEFLHFEQVSNVIGITVEELRDLNPQYKKDIIPAKVRTYPLRLPISYVDDFITYKDSIFAYKDSVYFSPERKVVAPPKYQKGSSHTANYSPPPTKDAVKIMYTVKSGDNVGFIASWYGVRVSDVSYWNNLYKNRIKAGQKLVIYKNKNLASKYLNINKMSFEAKQKSVGKTATKTSTTTKTTTSTNAKTSGKYVYYTVRRGDNFWTIAKKYPGVSNEDIMKLNGITDPTSLRAGQKLKIKKK